MTKIIVWMALGLCACSGFYLYAENIEKQDTIDLFQESAINDFSNPPKIWLESKQIDLGVVGPEQNTIVGAIHFMNDGAQPLEIRKVIFEP